MTESDDLVAHAQKQLDEHKTWLAGQIYMCPNVPGGDVGKHFLITQSEQIRLRVAKTSGNVVSVVWEYPDELYAFLNSELTPVHLRAAIAGGHVVDPNKPTFEVRRESEP